MEPKKTRVDDKRFTLRLEKELYEKLVVESEKERRPIGRQIEYIIALYFEEKEKN